MAAVSEVWRCNDGINVNQNLDVFLCGSLQAADVKRVVDFCRENRPQAIFVGARNLSCKVLKEAMSLIGDFILDAHAQVNNALSVRSSSIIPEGPKGCLSTVPLAGRLWIEGVSLQSRHSSWDFSPPLS